jgi:HD superfamily phosphohydrolase
MAAALLHDLGHWPMAHPIEDIELEGQPTHEQFAAQFLAPGSELADVLHHDWNIAPGEVLDVLHPRHNDPPRRLIRSLLSGPVDVDKLDYLERDSLHCGVPYGRNFDKNRLISSLLVNEAGDGLALSSKGKTAAELMIFARYVMFGEVYWHHAVRSATAMFARAFFELRRCFSFDVLKLVEADLISWLKRTAESTPWQALVDGVFGPRRGLYKRMLELSRFSHPELYDRLAHRSFAENAAVATELAARLGSRLGETITPSDVLLDAPPRHREVETHLELYDARLQVYRPLRDVSPVVRALATTQFDDYVKRVRVFVHPRLTSRLRGDDEITRDLSRSIDSA